MGGSKKGYIQELYKSNLFLNVEQETIISTKKSLYHRSIKGDYEKNCYGRVKKAKNIELYFTGKTL